MVARYSPVKDHRTLLQAVHDLRAQGRWPARAKVLLVGGTTYAEARAEVERTVAQLELQSVVEVRGVTPEVEQVYHALDVLVLPSLYEGFPNTVLEAMACGVPAIVSSAANAAGVVLGGRDGLGLSDRRCARRWRAGLITRLRMAPEARQRLANALAPGPSRATGSMSWSRVTSSSIQS